MADFIDKRNREMTRTSLFIYYIFVCVCLWTAKSSDTFGNKAANFWSRLKNYVANLGGYSRGVANLTWTLQEKSLRNGKYKRRHFDPAVRIKLVKKVNIFIPPGRGSLCCIQQCSHYSLIVVGKGVEILSIFLITPTSNYL